MEPIHLGGQGVTTETTGHLWIYTCLHSILVHQPGKGWFFKGLMISTPKVITYSSRPCEWIPAVFRSMYCGIMALPFANKFKHSSRLGRNWVQLWQWKIFSCALCLAFELLGCLFSGNCQFMVSYYQTASEETGRRTYGCGSIPVPLV